MKNTIIAISIIAVAAISLGVSGVTANPMMIASVPAMSSGSQIIGHLEYTLVDDAGNIKKYGQTDNFITTAGDRCIAESLFERGSGDTSNANCIDQAFGVIGIGNSTETAEDNVNLTELSAGVNSAGIMSTVNATSINLSDPDVTTEDSFTQVTTVLSNSGHPFVFSDDTSVTNMTSGTSTNTLKNAYLLQSICAGVPIDGTCDAIPGGEVLAVQSLSNLSVSDGDSLTITWTVTIGADDS